LEERYGWSSSEDGWLSDELHKAAAKKIKLGRSSIDQRLIKIDQINSQ